MIKKTFKRVLIPAVAILLFVAIFSVIICAVPESTTAEKSNSEENVSYTVTVTSPSGNDTDQFIDSWVFDLFTKEEPLVFYDVSSVNSTADAINLIDSGKAPAIEVSLAEYVKDIQLYLSRSINKVNAKVVPASNLIGITSLSCDTRLLPESGCQITWKEGYDESIFGGEDLLCIIPESMAKDYDNGNGSIDMYFKSTGVVSTTIVDGKPVVEKKETEYQCTLKIVGTYTGGDEKSIYCPASVVQQVYGELGENVYYRSLSATLADNSRLEEFREKMSLCFIEPSPNAEETSWGYMLVREVDGASFTKYYEFYPYALDIEAAQSLDLPTTPNDSENLIHIVIVIILALIVGSLSVILIIHSRKRHITRKQKKKDLTSGTEGDILPKNHKTNRIKLARVRTIALVLFAVVSITIAALCVINEVKLHKQEEALRSNPITVTVIPLADGNGGFYSIDPWTTDLFTGKNPVEIMNKSSGNSETTQISLSEYLKDVRIKMSYRIDQLNGSPVYSQTVGQYPNLIGITSIPSDELLLPENGCEITWYEGYDESAFGGEELVCLIPEGKAEAYDNGTGEAVLYFCYAWGRMENGTYVEVSRTEYECTLKIVGTYTAGDEVSIYCPFSIIEQVYEGLGEKSDVDSISATLKDNLLLDEFCEKASVFYSNLSENAQNSSDGIMVLNRSNRYMFAPDSNALDIINTAEFDVSAAREENERFNRIAIIIIVILAIIVGLVLVIPKIHIRRRKVTRVRRVARVRKAGILKPKELCGLILKLIVSSIRGCILLIKHTINRMKRTPVRAIAVLLFAAVVSVIICALQASNDEEMRHYEEAYQAVPIKFSVTQPSYIGETLGYGSSLLPWVIDLFTENNTVEIIDVSAAKDRAEKHSIVDNTAPTEISLKEYVKDLQVKMSYTIETVNGKRYRGMGTSFLIGMTSLSCDKQLLPEYGCEITWYEGYDESIFEGGEAVCLIPESKANAKHYDNGNGEAELYFSYSKRKLVDGVSVEVEGGEYDCTLKIVGTYTAGDELSIYCPFSIIDQVYEGLGREPKVDSLSATIADNRRLEEFIEKANMFFMDPSQKDEEVPWGIALINRSTEYLNDYYRYAIDINDENLSELAAILEDSIKFNRTVTVFVVILSVVAGFLIGFLMIRRRKRDIMLMRTVGESNFRVYLGFVIEQMICIVLGVIVGGAYYLWNPINNLVLFALVYFVALSLALVIFMSKKLLTTVKEDE